eukprot:TRINITY_DN3522_c0_g2_i13.p1 TRINITY_DN3522_c0_g2~~TRINITY_DN3522_c0_g2_i13.p1  ORF type:complete len:375 (+),score=34.53 TRINITY_DN3522_c0_g2_i13:1374-2498(+)
MCFSFNVDLLDWQLRFDPYWIDIVSTNYPFEKFTPLGLEFPLNATSICFPVTGQNLSYFVVGLVKEYKSLQVQYTWTQEEMGLIIFITVSYFILFCWSTASLILRLINITITTVFYPEVGLVFLVSQCVLRLIYFIGVPFATFEYETLSILFSDLPQLLFHEAVIITGIMWNDIVLQVNGKQVTRDRKIFISYFFMGLLFLCFVVVSIAYASLIHQHRIFTCSSTDAERNAIAPSTLASIAYKSIFALYSVIIVIIFAIQSLEILKMLNSLQEQKRHFHKFFTASFFSIVGLLLQASIALYCTVGEMKNTTKLALIIVSEVFPTFFLIFVFHSENAFKAIFKTLTRTPKTSKSSGSKERSNVIPKPVRSKVSSG